MKSAGSIGAACAPGRPGLRGHDEWPCGDRQKVLFATRLFDEATSHLDIHMEREVVKSLAKLALTRIVVAHRPQTVAGADRVISVFNGRVSELNKPPTPSPTDHESTSGAVFVGA
jgi:ABC-type polar amino acid transport system ATPase subunit